MKATHTIHAALKAAMLSAALILLLGCPESPRPDNDYNGGNSEYDGNNLEYEEGFLTGFLEDDEYWLGYSDSYNTVPDGPILYSGSEIPYVEEPPYDAGYWDGVWYAYNDGYFVCYDYGFTIGFSEGYDLAYRPDWYALLAHDVHPEYFDGSFADGYNDGFSEGSIFGASDYLEEIDYDWFEAMWDYREGLDLYIEEIDRGTGEWGPVYLYEYGMDPHDYHKRAASPSRASAIRRSRPTALKSARAPSMRTRHAVAPVMEKDVEPSYDPDEISYRSLTSEAREKLDVAPTQSKRAEDVELTLTDTWLERIQTYRESLGK